MGVVFHIDIICFYISYLPSLSNAPLLHVKSVVSSVFPRAQLSVTTGASTLRPGYPLGRMSAMIDWIDVNGNLCMVNE